MVTGGAGFLVLWMATPLSAVFESERYQAGLEIIQND
jgi:hypothetical protein